MVPGRRMWAFDLRSSFGSGCGRSNVQVRRDLMRVVRVRFVGVCVRDGKAENREIPDAGKE